MLPFAPLQQSFKRYPALKDQFNAVVIQFFRDSMVPTTKLVSDMVSMQACYVNTTHPDFLNGHKAMALVSDRMAAARPVEKVDPKKISSASLNNNKDLEVDVKKEEPSFFSTFFPAGSRSQPKKKGVSVMDAVSCAHRYLLLTPPSFADLARPPFHPVL